MSLGHSCDNSYISCLLLITTLYFTCGEREKMQIIKKYQNIKAMIAEVFFKGFTTFLMIAKSLRRKYVFVQINRFYINYDINTISLSKY